MAIGAILLDAGGVLLFPQPDGILPALRGAGVRPDRVTLQRAHYRAMSLLDRPGTAEPERDTWWRSYLRDYVAECGVPRDRGDDVAGAIAQDLPGFGWTYVPPSVPAALRAIAGLGVPVGIVSNSDGSVQSELRRLGVCYAADAQAARDGERGVRVDVVIDSTVVGVAKPDPEIFRVALTALGIPPGREVLHVGDSLRYDVTGALAAGLRPVHLDPFGFCPAPDGHDHVRSLPDVLTLR